MKEIIEKIIIDAKEAQKDLLTLDDKKINSMILFIIKSNKLNVTKSSGLTAFQSIKFSLKVYKFIQISTQIRKRIGVVVGA